MWALYRLGKMNVFEIIHRIKQEIYNKKLRKNSETKLDEFKINWFDISINSNNIAIDEVINRDEIILYGEKIKVNLNTKFIMDPKKKENWGEKFFKDIVFRNSENYLDPKVIWEINKQQYLVTWGLKYVETKDIKYAKYIIDDIRAWISQNREYYTINWCSGLEISIRCINWIVSLNLIKNFIENNNIYLDDIINSLYKQTLFVYNRLSLFSSANNHLIGELTFILFSCTFINFDKNSKIFNKCLVLMNKQIYNQFHEDGVNKEQSINYQLHTMEFYLISKYLLNSVNKDFNHDTIKILKNAAHYINSITTKEGDTFNIGDEDGGKIITCSAKENQVLYILYLCKSILNYDFAITNKNIYTDSRFSLFNISEVDLDVENDKWNKDYFYDKGGMYVRTTDKILSLFDCGESGLKPLYAHAHNDALSINLNIDNKFFLVDNGTYKYHHTDGLRDYFRGVSAHNTISINKQNHFKLLGPFMCSKSPKVFMSNNIDTINGKLYLNRNYIIERELNFLNDNTIIIKDSIINKNNRNDLVEIYFNLHPECVYEKINNKYNIKNGNVNMILTLDENLYTKVKTVPYSEKYGELSSTTQILGFSKIDRNEVFYHKIEF